MQERVRPGRAPQAYIHAQLQEIYKLAIDIVNWCEDNSVDSREGSEDEDDESERPPLYSYDE